MAIISGKAYWASIQKPRESKFSDIPQYEMTIALSDKEVERIKDVDAIIHSKIKDDDKGNSGGGKILKVKLPTRSRQGKPNNPPRVVDAAKNPFKDLVGNGSDVNVIVRSFETPMGAGMRLEAVQVVKLVSYAESEDFDAMESELDDKLPF